MKEKFLIRNESINRFIKENVLDCDERDGFLRRNNNMLFKAGLLSNKVLVIEKVIGLEFGAEPKTIRYTFDIVSHDSITDKAVLIDTTILQCS